MQLLVVVRVEVAMQQVGLKIVNVIGRINNTKITTMSMEEGSSITSTTIKVTSLCYVNEEQNIAISMRCLNQQEQHLVILQLPTTLLTPHIIVHQTTNKQLAQQLQQQKLSPLELQLQRQKQAEQQK